MPALKQRNAMFFSGGTVLTQPVPRSSYGFSSSHISVLFSALVHNEQVITYLKKKMFQKQKELCTD